MVWTTLAAAEILSACLNRGDEASWRAFVECFQPAIAGGVTRVVGRFAPANRALVDDLVQETYLKLMRDDCRILRNFVPEHENAIYGFLSQIANRVAIDHYRSGKGRESEELDSCVNPRMVTPPDEMERNVLLNEVTSFLRERSSDRDQAIFGLYYFQGFSAVQIAGMPGIDLSQKGVEACLHRLRLLLQACVAGDVSAEPKGKARLDPLGAME